MSAEATDHTTPLPPDAQRHEARRLEILEATGLLNPVPEQEFEELISLAGYICDTPMAFISILNKERDAFHIRLGSTRDAISRENSFCTHALLQEGLFVVNDTLEDHRFRTNPYVLEHTFLRFYAGFPLRCEGGIELGTLCVLDTRPRRLSLAQKGALETLARQVIAQIDLRTQVQALAATMADKQRITRDLEISDTRFRAFMDANPAAAFIKDESGRMVYCNRAATSRFEATPEQWIGRTDQDLWGPELGAILRAKDCSAMDANQLIRSDDETKTPNGKVLNWDVYRFPFADPCGKRFLAGLALDVTKERATEKELLASQQQLRELNLKLHKLSLTDGLTRVKNRRGLEDCLQREFERSRRSEAPLSLLMLDVDHFKKFNDAFGHIAGDQVLQRIAMLMKENTRKYDLVARYGGEEFIALLPDTLEQEAMQIAARLCHSIASDHWKHRPITVSVGIGSLQPGIPTASDFINAVDQALYVAKANGRNQVCLMSNAQQQMLLQTGEASA